MIETYKVPLGRWGTYRPDSITIRLSGIRFFSNYLEFWKDYNYCTIMFDRENKQVIFKRMKYRDEDTLKVRNVEKTYFGLKSNCFIHAKLKQIVMGKYSGTIDGDIITVNVEFVKE